MGCDGGSIPKRSELVKTSKKKDPKNNSKDLSAAKWTCCHLSQERLQKPVVADLLGHLYNKEAIIEYLLNKSKFNVNLEHINSIKDVKELKLTLNPIFKQENESDAKTVGQSQWICPISGPEMNGNFKFYYLFTCGCVFSEKSFKYLTEKTLSNKCIKCEEPYNQNDLIILNPGCLEEFELNQKILNSRSDSSRKVLSSNKSSLNKNTSNAPKSKKRPIDVVNNLNNKKLKIDELNLNNGEKFKSIQDDPNVSDLYKSLFNTSSKAINQQKAHWVTFNPQYFY